MKYICEGCSYETDNHFCFKQHLNSKKHIEKVKCIQNKKRSSLVVNSVLQTDYQCQFCEKTFYNAGSLSRHRSICSEKEELVNENKKLNEKIESLEYLLKKEEQHSASEIETLKNENEYLKTIINNAGNIIKTSVSTLSYVSQHYNEAPVLEPIKDYSKLTYDIDSEGKDDKKTKKKKKKSAMDIRKDKDHFLDILICKHEKNTLDRYLGEIIVKCYKKENPKDQSLWSSDTSRLTYVVRELFANQKIDWTIDKKGVKTRNYIVKPLLEHIDNLMKEYIQIYSITDRAELDMRDYEPKLKRMNKMSEIMIAISNGTLAENVVGFVAPEFYLNKGINLPKLKQY